MTRRETIVELVRLYPAAIDGGGGKSLDFATTGRESKRLKFSDLWYASPRTWKAFEKCLGELKRAKPHQYAHLRARYWQTMECRRKVRFVKRTRNESVPIGLADNEQLRIEGPAEVTSVLVRNCLVESWPSWVLDSEVERALKFLDRTLPDPLDSPLTILERKAA